MALDNRRCYRRRVLRGWADGAFDDGRPARADVVAGAVWRRPVGDQVTGRRGAAAIGPAADPGAGPDAHRRRRVGAGALSPGPGRDPRAPPRLLHIPEQPAEPGPPARGRP